MTESNFEDHGNLSSLGPDGVGLGRRYSPESLASQLPSCVTCLECTGADLEHLPCGVLDHQILVLGNNSIQSLAVPSNSSDATCSGPRSPWLISLDLGNNDLGGALAEGSSVNSIFSSYFAVGSVNFAGSSLDRVGPYVLGGTDVLGNIDMSETDFSLGGGGIGEDAFNILILGGSFNLSRGSNVEIGEDAFTSANIYGNFGW